MNTPPTDLLRLCPDCGGILEPSRPGWVATIDFTAFAAPSGAADVSRWRCLLCGYREQTPKAPDGAADQV